MSEKTSFLTKLKTKISFKNKNIIISFVVILVCVLALMFCGTLGQKNSSEQEQSSAEKTNETCSALEYANQVGANLCEIINNVKGLSNAKVVVVVESSPIVNYLTDKNQDGEAIVYIKNGSKYEPAVVSQFLPKITGILVVANGISNLEVKYNLLNAISAVYNVDISSIEILEGK